MPLKWYGEPVRVKLVGMVYNRCVRAAKMVRDHIKEQLSVPHSRTRGAGHKKRGLDPSAPGDYPRKVLGHLRRNIQAEGNPQLKAARVGTNYKVGKWLELGTRKMARRPWLSKALKEKAAEIRQVLAGNR